MENVNTSVHRKGGEGKEEKRKMLWEKIVLNKIFTKKNLSAFRNNFQENSYRDLMVARISGH